MSAPALTAAPAAKATAAAAAGFDIVAALKDAGFAALVALGLCIPILSYKTEQNGGVLFLASRWGLVALICALVFAGRLAYRAYDFQRASRKSAAAATPAIAARHATGTGVLSRIGVPLFLGVALGFPFIVYAVQGGLTESRYWVDLGVLMLTYVMLGWGLNIVVGLAGLLDLGYVAFYAVGAYSYALLSTTFGLSFWICLPIAGMLAAFWGILLGFPVLRLRGDYLAIVVLGGMGSQIGVAIAAVVLVGGPEMLRNLGFLKAIFGKMIIEPEVIRMLLFGLALVLMMLYRPAGILPSALRKRELETAVQK